MYGQTHCIGSVGTGGNSKKAKSLSRNDYWKRQMSNSSKYPPGNHRIVVNESPCILCIGSVRIWKLIWVPSDDDSFHCSGTRNINRTSSFTLMDRACTHEMIKPICIIIMYWQYHLYYNNDFRSDRDKIRQSAAFRYCPGEKEIFIFRPPPPIRTSVKNKSSDDFYFFFSFVLHVGNLWPARRLLWPPTS